MVQFVRRGFPLLAALMALIALESPSPACPFCDVQGRTLAAEVSEASMVLYGKLVNANETNETTDIEIETVIKDNPVRGKRMQLTINRFTDLTMVNDKDRHIIFCDLFKGRIDPFRGMVLKAGSKLPEYLRSAVQMKDKPVIQRLRFYFDYLDNDDSNISSDAYKEFGLADYKDFKTLAKDLPVERIIGWLKSPHTPSYKIGLYASMIGHAGKEKDGKVLRELLDDPEKRASNGIDGLLAGYAMLQPKEGWSYLLSALKNTKEDFTFRYAALRAVRFLHDFRSDVVSRKDLLDGLCVLLTQDDISDLAIEDLRKWEAWGCADKVLAVCKTDAYNLPIVKRAVLRYCLQCKDVPAARTLVAERRKSDAEAVKEAEEILKLDHENNPSTGSPKTVTKK